MNLPVKKILGTGLALGLTALSLAAQNVSPFGSLPLWFEAGQPAEFTAHASGSEFSISATEAKFTLSKNNGELAGCRLQFVGANPAARITGNRPLTGRINYLLGNNPAQWRADVPTFAQVRVRDLYPGVNVVYYGNRHKLEYDLNLAAGVNPSVIALRFDGAEKVSVNPQGGLSISFDSGTVVQHPPVAYQTIHGTRQEIAASYKILDAHTAAFALGHYDHREPLVIDPVLSYSTYFGGNYGETGWAIAVNPADGSIYVAGQTFSTKDTNNIPASTFSTSGAFQTSYHGGKQAGDAFVARFDGTGTNLIYATYLGGNADDSAYAIAVDNAGNAFVAGGTASTNFPVKNFIATGGKISGKMNPTLHVYPADAFVTELDPGGSNLIYSTYLGGNSADAAFGIALDSDDDAFITGFTYSTNFPVTQYAYQSRMACSNTVINANAFVAEISAGGTNLNYSTFLGGTNFDVGRAIAWNNNRLFVAGYTASTNFPVTNYIQRLVLIATNVFAKKVNNVLTNYDVVVTNVFDGQYLNGRSTNKINQRIDLGPDAFVTAFDTTSKTSLALLYSTFLGGTNDDRANGIAADANGSAYVTGYTTSTNFPDTVPDLCSSYVRTNGTGYLYATNGFLTRIDYSPGTNATIGYSAMFGGEGLDVANGIALDPAGNAYVVGSVTSTNFPVYPTNNLSDFLTATNNSLKNRRFSDVFIIAFNTNASALLYSTYLGGRLNDFGNAIAVDPLGNAYLTGQTLSTNFPCVNALQSRLDGTNDMFIAKISQNTNPPALLIAPEDSSVPPGISLEWQMFPPNYNLVGSADLASGNWLTVPGSPAYTNGWYQITLPATNGARFFRLQKN
jgi:hypothetical protein